MGTLRGSTHKFESVNYVLDALGLGVYPHENLDQRIVDAEAASVNKELKDEAED